MVVIDTPPPFTGWPGQGPCSFCLLVVPTASAGEAFHFCVSLAGWAGERCCLCDGCPLTHVPVAVPWHGCPGTQGGILLPFASLPPQRGSFWAKPRSLEAWTEAWESPGPEPLPRCRGSLRHSDKCPQSQKYGGGGCVQCVSCLCPCSEPGGSREAALPYLRSRHPGGLFPSRDKGSCLPLWTRCLSPVSEAHQSVGGSSLTGGVKRWPWAPESWIAEGAPAVQFCGTRGFSSALRQVPGESPASYLPSADTLKINQRGKNSKTRTNELKRFKIVIETQNHVKCTTQCWTIILLT